MDASQSDINPWERRPITCGTQLTTIIFGLILLVPRIVILLVHLIVAVPLLLICSKCGIDCLSRLALWVALRGSMLIMGFWWFFETGPAPQFPKDSSVVIIGNHIGYIEIMYMAQKYGPSFVAKAAISKMPIIGGLARAFHTIFVEREQKGKGISTTSTISSALSNPDKQLRLAMFPEGTTSNGKCILPFHKGAFIPGKPVIPIYFKLPNCGHDISFLGLSLAKHILITMCQPFNTLRVTRLPVYYPSEVEKNDAALFMTAVRDKYLQISGLPPGIGGFQEKYDYQIRKGLRRPVRVGGTKEGNMERLSYTLAGDDKGFQEPDETDESNKVPP